MTARGWSGRLLAGATAVTLAVSACAGATTTRPTAGGSDGAPAAVPGVTVTQVTIGSHQPLTGPAAPGYSEIAPAANAMFQYINSQGGINGRTIKYIYKDDGYNPTNTVTVVTELVQRDKVFAIFDGLGTPTHSKVTDFLNQQKVPDLFVASGASQWDMPQAHPYTFGWQPEYVIEGKILGQYVKNTYAGLKVGYFLQNDDFGSDGAKGLDKYIPGADVVGRETYEPGNIDVGPQIAALKAKGAQVIVCECIPAYTALTILTSLKLNYKPQLVVSTVGSDPTTLDGLLEAFAQKGGAAVKGSDLTQGIVTDSYLPSLTDPANLWTALFRKIHDQYIPTLPFDGNVEYGMAVGYTFAQALKAAGPNPTRDGIVQAVESSNLGGPGLVPYRYSATSHAGLTGTQVAVISGTGYILKGKPQTTDDAAGPIADYTAAQASPGDGGVLRP